MALGGRLSETLLRSHAGFCGFGGTVAWRRSRLHRFDQPARGIRNLIDRAVERRFIRPRRRREAGEFAYELKSGGSDFFLRRGGRKIEQGADVSAHGMLSFNTYELWPQPIYNAYIRIVAEKIMRSMEAEPVSITTDGGIRVSALWNRTSDARACLVLAHGAGAGMTHPFMAAVSRGLAERDIATLRYQFPYMEQGAKRPDPPERAHAAVRAAVAEALRLAPELPLFAGGKSFGGRMTSRAQSIAPLPHVGGLVFFGFPLHPTGKPSQARAKHLFDIQVPMVFLQGTRDALAEMTELEPVIKALGTRATLALFKDADHSFHVPARSGRTDTDVRNEMLDTLAVWIDTHAG
jgi:predicted alpha/beta-hydrolase family hydrolase